MGVFNPLFSEMTNVIGNIINESKYTMIYQQNNYTKEDDFETLQLLIKEKRLCGVICLGGNFKSIQNESLKELKVPVVFTSVNTIVDQDKNGYSSVGVDNEKSGYMATRYLIDLGHRDIAIMIGVKKDKGISNLRLAGYKRALKESNISVNEDYILEGDYCTQIAYKKMLDCIRTNKKVSAVFAISDFMAIGIAKAIVDSGLEIGKDISIVGFDGMDVSKFYNPGITTIKQPKSEIAIRSAKLLLDLIKGKTENTHIVLDTKLIKRESCRYKND